MKVHNLRHLLRDVRRLPQDSQTGVMQIFRAAITVAQRDQLPGPGEAVRLYRPKIDTADREARRQRIAAALAGGEHPNDIARRERVSRQWVYKVRRALAGCVPVPVLSPAQP